MGTKTQKLSNVVDQIVEWQSVVVADGSTNTTGVSGRGYFIDTSAGAHTVNLPASPKIGDIIKVSLITAGNQLTIGRNGNNINGTTSDIVTSADGDAYELVYVNVSEGWKIIGQITAATFTEATGGTVTTSGDFKIHTFTGDGCFVVSSTGNGDSNPLGGPSTVDYLVVAGGGGGGIGCSGAGGGAGGFRESKDSTVSSPHTASPLAATTGITVSTTTYPVTVGGGGTGYAAQSYNFPFPESRRGVSGSDSIFSTITSAGGGGGGGQSPYQSGLTGGSGGGGAHSGGTGGSGNTPPVSPPQGNSGANPAPSTGSAPSDAGGGGGGATTAAIQSPCGSQTLDHNGGAGATTSISGTPTAYAGGGGGTNRCGGGSNDTDGGVGGGGKGGYGTRPTPSPQGSGTSGTANTGGGGGGGKALTASCAPRPYGGSGAGGKGVVIIRYKFQ